MPIYLTTSPFLLASLLIIACGSEICVFCANLTTYWKLIVGILIIFYSGWTIWSTVLLKGKYAIISIENLSEANTWLGFKSGIKVSSQLINARIIANFCVLRFYVPSIHKTLSCTIVKDAIAPSQYRRLIMILRTLTI